MSFNGIHKTWGMGTALSGVRGCSYGRSSIGQTVVRHVVLLSRCLTTHNSPLCISTPCSQLHLISVSSSSSFLSIGAQVESEHVLSRLWIGRATAADSGNYSCSIPGHGAADFPRARVRVHVVTDGERNTSNHSNDFVWSHNHTILL